MSNLDAIAYIPLFATAVIALAILVFLIIIKIRNTAKVSFISFLSLAIIIFACIYTIIKPSIMTISLLQLIAAALIIPYCVMLALGKPREMMLIAPDAKATPDVPDAY